MHISYPLYYKYRSTCKILNSICKAHLCILRLKSCPQTVTEVAMKTLRGVKMDYWQQFRCKAKSHPGILTEKFATQNSSLILPLIRAESTFVPSADGCYKLPRCLYFDWFQN